MLRARQLLWSNVRFSHLAYLTSLRKASTVFALSSGRPIKECAKDMWWWSTDRQERISVSRQLYIESVCPLKFLCIFFPSLGQGKCGVAVVRVTGKRAGDVFTHMTHPATFPRPRMATLRHILHPLTGNLHIQSFE